MAQNDYQEMCHLISKSHVPPENIPNLIANNKNFWVNSSVSNLHARAKVLERMTTLQKSVHNN